MFKIFSNRTRQVIPCFMIDILIISLYIKTHYITSQLLTFRASKWRNSMIKLFFFLGLGFGWGPDGRDWENKVASLAPHNSQPWSRETATQGLEAPRKGRLEKAMAPHSSTLAWQIPWMEEPGRLQSTGSLRVGQDWATSLSLFTFMHWRRKWQPTPVFLPGESQGRGSLVGCHLWGRTESDTTEAT